MCGVLQKKKGLKVGFAIAESVVVEFSEPASETPKRKRTISDANLDFSGALPPRGTGLGQAQGAMALGWRLNTR